LDKATTITAHTLRTVKCISPHTTILGYSPDDMQRRANRSRYWIDALPYYDAYFTTKTYAVEELRQLGCTNPIFVDNAYDPHTHRPIEVSPEERHRIGGAVGFIGTYEFHRGQSIRSLATQGISVRIYGDGWANSREAMCTGLLVSGPSRYGEMYTRIICSFDINLAFLRKANRDRQTTRSVEIPACGAFMLAERSDEHLALFEEGKEAEFFDCDDELADKTRFYLTHADIRRRIAEAGRERCIRSGYSNHERLRMMLQSAKVQSN
jgi:hypothetical protein